MPGTDQTDAGRCTQRMRNRRRTNEPRETIVLRAEVILCDGFFSPLD
jgi:hypothetical protein